MEIINFSKKLKCVCFHGDVNVNTLIYDDRAYLVIRELKFTSQKRFCYPVITYNMHQSRLYCV